MREINKIAEGLFEKIRDRFEDVSLGDDNAKATTDPEKARFFNFDYTVDDHDHGNITMSLIDETSLKVYFSKNISDDLDKEHKKEWYAFLRELRRFAKENLLSFEPRDITRSTLKHRDLQQVSKADNTYDKDDVVSESLYGTRKSSYERKGPVRIIVRHSKPIEETENHRARSHHINSIYIETQEGERFKLPVKSLRLGRALAQHLKQGGSMQDDLGRHICEMAQECAKLKPFINNTRHRTFEDTQTQSMAEAAFEYHGLLNNSLKRMTGKKGYQRCKEQFVATSTSYIPEVDTEEMKQRFEKRTFDDRLEEALPLVHKAYNMKKENKFAEQFVNWADTIAEGTWAAPSSDDEVAKLIDVLSNPLPAGVDGQNATNILYDIIGDDRLFDQIAEVAKVDPQEDVRSVVENWLQDHLPHIYQQIQAEIGDPDVPEPFEQGQEDDVAEGDTYGSGDSGMDGQVTEDDDKDPKEQSRESAQAAIIRRIMNSHTDALMHYGPKLIADAVEEYAYNLDDLEEIGTSDVSIWTEHVLEILSDMDMQKQDDREEYQQHHAGNDTENDPQVRNTEFEESKDKVTYDPKTGKLTGWEHEGDWKKQTKKKDPVGKVHHMSDVARKRTEKMSQDETLEEAFDRLVNEDDTLTEDQVSDKLQSFVGQTFYVPAEGQKGTVSSVADQTRFSNSLVVDLANGTTTAVHFKDLNPVEETPGPIKQLWQRLVATITGGATPKMQPKINAPVSDISTPKDFQKLAGIK